MDTKSLLYLWKERTLYMGWLDDEISLSQGAATLALSVEGSMSVCVNGSKEWHECTSLLLPAGCNVQIDCKKNLTANINLDVMGFDFFRLRKNMSRHIDGIGLDLKCISRFRKVLSKMLRDQPSSTDAKQQLENLISHTGIQNTVADQRIEKVVALIQGSIGENLSIDHLAEQVNLSVAALTRLFKQQTGVPIRRYRQWHRLYVTATEIGHGKNLTDAALTAGFVDLSHCTHTFNMMLGMKPSYFLLRPESIHVISEPI